jgi:hypothetical protein
MLIANGAANSVTDASPCANRARIARRVGSASAAKTSLNGSVAVSGITKPLGYLTDKFTIARGPTRRKI